jgi:hypothetical protein
MTIPKPVAYTRAQRYQSGLSIVNILIICGFLYRLLCCCIPARWETTRELFFSAYVCPPDGYNKGMYVIMF